MIHRYLFSLVLALLPLVSLAQCPDQLVPRQGMSAFFVSSQLGAQPFSLALDGNPSTWYGTEWDKSLPHEVRIRLGGQYDISRIAILPRSGADTGHPLEYTLYASNDSLNWGQPKAAGALAFDNFSDPDTLFIRFGAVQARYLRLVVSAVYGSRPHTWWMAGEMAVFASTCGVTAQSHQTIAFASITKKRTDQGPLNLKANASSSLPVSFEVISGPATVSGSVLSFTGTEGRVIVRAFQPGDAQFHAAETYRFFDVVDPQLHPMAIQTRLVGTYALEMPVLKPYPIYTTLTNAHPDLFQADSVVYVIGGKTYDPELSQGLYTVWWQPDSFGPYSVDIKAYGSHGVVSTKNVTLLVWSGLGNKQIQTFSGEVINFGSVNSQEVRGTFELPQFVGAYDQITARWSVNCPNVVGGCDDWDRVAQIEVKTPEGEWVEFIRYITPYGVGCSHSVDVTPYASLLQGKVEFRVYIETWGSGGWGVNLRLDYRSGTPAHDYADIDPIWKRVYPFGDPANLQPVDTLSIDFRDDAAKTELLLMTTGHGWGDNNTDNAAEFYDATHFIEVNGATAFTQSLMRACSPNPDGCQPQNGTYTFPRAGWCPGAISPPDIYDLTAYQPLGNIELAYIFDPTYVDLCHVNNPNCRSGVTCPNCNDGFNPIYFVAGNLVSWYDTVTATQPRLTTSNDPLRASGAAFSLSPNPTSRFFQVNGLQSTGEVQVEVFQANGKKVLSARFDHAAELEQHQFYLSNEPAGLFLVKIRSGRREFTQKLLLN